MILTFVASPVCAAQLQAQVNPAFYPRGKPAWVGSESFAAIGSAVTFPDGRVIVSAGEPGRMRLIVVDNVGRMRALSRTGDGPGEYRSMLGIFRLTDSTAAVVDARLLRLLIVSPSGPLSTVPLVRSIADPPRLPAFIDAVSRHYNVPSALEVRGPRLPLTRLNRATNVLDTMAMLSVTPIELSAPRKTADGNLQLEVVAPPFFPQDRWAACSDGTIAVARTDPFRVDIISPTGAVSTGPVVARAPVLVSRVERDSLIRRGVDPRGIPAVKPPFLQESGMVADECDRFWLEVTNPLSAPGPLWLAFDRRGSKVDSVTLKPYSRIVAFGANAILVARRDTADDLHYLEQYRRSKKR